MNRLLQRRRTLAIGIAALACAAFLPVLDNGFVGLDDGDLITRNPMVRRGLSWRGAAYAFTSLDTGNWHPITWLSHALDCQIFGLNPAGPPAS